MKRHRASCNPSDGIRSCNPKCTTTRQTIDGQTRTQCRPAKAFSPTAQNTPSLQPKYHCPLLQKRTRSAGCIAKQRKSQGARCPQQSSTLGKYTKLISAETLRRITELRTAKHSLAQTANKNTIKLRERHNAQTTLSGRTRKQWPGSNSILR